MSGKRPRAIFLLVPVLLIGLLGAWWGVRSEGAAPAQTPDRALTTPAPGAAAPAASQTPPPAALAAIRVWSPETLYRYAMTAEQRLSFRQKQPAMNAPPGMRFAIQGEWNVGVISAGDTRIDARVHLKVSSFNVSVDSEGPLAPDVQRTMTQALQVPFFLSFAPTGEVVQTHFEQSADVLTRGLLRSLLAASQFVVDGAPGDDWKTEEFDTTGKYQSAYHRQAAQRFDKKKLSYSHVTTPLGLEPLGQKIQIVVRSSATFELQEELWTNTLQTQERLEVEAGESMPAATYELTLALRLLERRKDASLSGALAARRAFLDSAAMSSFQGAHQDPMDQYRQVLGGKNFDLLVKQLRALPTEPNARDDVRTQVLEQLRALFMLQPAEARKVPDAIRAGLDPLAASPMLGALSAASTPEAISSLAEVTRDAALSTDIRTDAVAALGMAGEPNREGVEALRQATRDREPGIRDTATLGLGNSAFQMGGGDSRGAGDVLQELIRAYHAATSAEQQALALRALGNTRSPAALDVLQQGLTSATPPVRMAALEALRNIPGPQADQLLARHLLTDPVIEVRRAAIFSCGFRPLEPVLAALDQALRTDSADGVRSDILHLLGEHRGVQPAALPMLLWASQNEPNLELRKVALDFLNTPATPVPSQATSSTP